MGSVARSIEPEIPREPNPMGTDGFEFVEFAHPEPEKLGTLFKMMRFEEVARHRSKNAALYRQGDVNFVLNAEPDSFAADFAKRHGPSACAIGFRSPTQDAPFAAHSRWAQFRPRPKWGQWSSTSRRSKA